MGQAALKHVFEENAGSSLKVTPAPLLKPEAYFNLLETLLTQGSGWGKTMPVAAYRLSDMFLVNETDNTENKIRIQNLYVVMDPKDYPNAYSRSLVMQDLMSAYARRMVGETDINAFDFKGPGIWTSKKSSFDTDYKARTAEPLHDEYGRPLHLYDPNPDAYRVCLDIGKNTMIPTSWGEGWEIHSGGTLAVRESDVKELSKAIAEIRAGHKTIREALYNGSCKKARFDVYGMAPGFLKDNYNTVALKKETTKALRALSRKTDDHKVRHAVRKRST